MTFNVPSLASLRRQARDDIKSKIDGSDATLRGSNLRAYAEAMGGIAHGLYRFLEYIARQAVPDLAKGVYLDRWLSLILEGGRGQATFAEGQVTVTGVPGSKILTGAELFSGGEGYTVDAGVTIPVSGSIDVQVRATAPGEAYNRDIGDALRFVSLPDGVDNDATVSGLGVQGGAEQETDADGVARMVARLQAPPAGGNANDYETWAKDVAGCTRAWSRGTVSGIGSQTTFVMFDVLRADQQGIPTTEDLAAVHAYIASLRPTTAYDQFVLAAVPVPLNLTITELSDDTPAVRQAISDNIAEMLLERAEPGGKIRQAWISEAISAAVGEDEHESDAVTLTPASNEIVVPGTITYA